MSTNISKELLDFEDCRETFIEKKIAGLLMKKSKSKFSNKRNKKQTKPGKPGESGTFPLEPPTALYSRINEFLPQIASENEENDKNPMIMEVDKHVEGNDQNLMKMEEDKHVEGIDQPLIMKKNKHIEEIDQSLIMKREPGNLKTFPLEPPANLYSKVAEFLPCIASKNKQLAKEDPTRINIEHIEEDTEYVIEWDIGVGVFEHVKELSEELSEDDIIIRS
ncbi:36484_t:CDS:2, partial [Gigaspora margarita]